MAMRCPICSSDEHALITDQVRFGNKADVLKCRQCALIYLDQGSFTLPADFYEGDYHQTYITHVEPSAFDPGSYYQKMLQVTRPWSDKINKVLTGKETVLDFGCSTGHLLTQIQGNAKKVMGHELNKKEVEFCRDKLGLDVSNIPLEERFSEGTFDLITMVFVLEHIARPVELLADLKKFLKPGGSFIILVPNAQDALLSFYNIPEFANFYFCVEHLFYYTPKTIRRLFTLAGLDGDIETIQEYPIGNHLNWGYYKKPSDTLASRGVMPNIQLADDGYLSVWESFWKTVDDEYRKLLGKLGFGDRLWCSVK
ncbi:MAG TPA: class I SAM-dependent methyltransferase [Syntrophorhabdaceae bacterium]|nr:class I SAM-dependent methyltransferase [Syntrophorhabdaceae bacterium]